MGLEIIIEEDIKCCERCQASSDIRQNYSEYKRIIAKYSGHIDHFTTGLIRSWNDDNGIAVKQNLTMIKEKLELFKAKGYENPSQTLASQVSITNNNSNNNNITISFDETRNSISNMTALPDPEINEILLKIDELEKIVKSSDRKSKKWEKAKDIIYWIADKGVDVGIALLPLLLQI